MLGNTFERWGSVQIGLHWLVAALILIQVPAGWGMVLAGPGATQDLLYAVHKNVGVIVFILACIRLVWRWQHPVPYLPADLPGWQATAARLTHFLLYLLLFLMPLTGFLYTTLSGFPVPFLMVWDLAQYVPVNKPLGEWFKLAHLTSAMAALCSRCCCMWRERCSIISSARTRCCGACCRRGHRSGSELRYACEVGGCRRQPAAHPSRAFNAANRALPARRRTGSNPGRAASVRPAPSGS